MSVVKSVSIPVWCDLEGDMEMIDNDKYFSFNSSMVRFGDINYDIIVQLLLRFNSSMVRFGA